MTASTTTIQPLREVTSVTQTGRTGTQINPNCFWLAHEFVLHLKCGHEQIRVKDVYRELAPVLAALPKRVRCSACDPVTRPVRKRKVVLPQHDELALSINSSLLATGASMDELVNASYEADQDERRRAHVRVASALLEFFAPAADHPHCDGIADALSAALANPSDEAIGKVRKQTRRLYHAQHRGNGSWYARRGIIAGMGVLGDTRLASEKYAEALSWVHTADRDAFYAHLSGLRVRYDAEAALAVGLSEMLDDAVLSGIDEAAELEVSAEIIDGANQTWDELRSTYNDQKWDLEARIHGPLIRACARAYADAPKAA